MRKIEALCHIAFSPKEQGDQDPLETKVASGLRLGAKPLMLPFEGKRLYCTGVGKGRGLSQSVPWTLTLGRWGRKM